LGEIASMLGKALLDPNPEMKNKGVAFAAEMARELRQHKVGQYLRSVIVSCVANL
jgi:hypothetical protein